jgi:hypothetical protein
VQHDRCHISLLGPPFRGWLATAEQSELLLVNLVTHAQVVLQPVKTKVSFYLKCPFSSPKLNCPPPIWTKPSHEWDAS